MKKLWAGNKHFLPLKFHNPSSSGSVVSLRRPVSALSLSDLPTPALLHLGQGSVAGKSPGRQSRVLSSALLLGDGTVTVLGWLLVGFLVCKMRTVTCLGGLVGESPMRQGCWTYVSGVQGFLPSGTIFPFKSQVAIARYSGWQIAYILWGKCHRVTYPIQHMFPGHLVCVGRTEVRQKQPQLLPLRGLQEGERITWSCRSFLPPVLSPQGVYAKGGCDPEEEVTVHTQGRA